MLTVTTAFSIDAARKTGNGKKIIFEDPGSHFIVICTTWKRETICPTVGARKLSPGEWPTYTKEIRKIAFELRDAGKVLIMQKGNEVAGSEVVGPIRIRIK